MPSEYVLDTSAAAKLLRREKESPALRSWLRTQQQEGARFFVPPVFRFELLNLVVRLVRVGEMDKGDAWHAYLRILDVVETDEGPDAEEILTEAVLQEITASDASFALLTLGGRMLVTYDDQLRKSVKRSLAPA